VTYKVELAHQAEKMLDRLDRVTEKRLRDRLKEISSNPYDPRLTDDVIRPQHPEPIGHIVSRILGG
jgi:mRNA-degrading endonuclease RelE of RelBE toxin-antitoxin system